MPGGELFRQIDEKRCRRWLYADGVFIVFSSGRLFDMELSPSR
jgi:hypothetical protein